MFTGHAEFCPVDWDLDQRTEMEESKNDILEGVKTCLGDVLRIKELSRIVPESSLIADLGADSLDFLDLRYQLEEHFDIEISNSEINFYSNLGLSLEEIHEDGVLTPQATTKLRELMPELNNSQINSDMKISEVPKLITVQTLISIIEKKLSKTQDEQESQ